jgi:hypothetical protein
MFVGIAQEGNDFIFFSRVQCPFKHGSACRLGFLDQRCQLVTLTTTDEDGKAFRCEFFAISPPIKSPAPITATVAFFFCMAISGQFIVIAPDRADDGQSIAFM